MKNCENYAALLDPFIDGELSPDEAARVQAHLDECPVCRAYVDDALAIRSAFPDAEDTELPEGFTKTVMARIRAEAAPRAEAEAAATEAPEELEAPAEEARAESISEAEPAQQAEPEQEADNGDPN